MGIRFRRRFEEEGLRWALASSGGVLFALLLSAALLALRGISPASFFYVLLEAPFGSSYGLKETAVKAVPIAFCALAVSLSFRMLLWNIGAEGQLHLGAFAAALFARHLDWGSRALNLPAMGLSAFVAGGLYASLVGLLKVRLRVNEVISSLMLNYVALLWMDYLVYGPWKDPSSLGFPMTPLIPPSHSLPVLIPPRLHLGVLLVVLSSAALHLLLERTSFGYEVRVTGSSKEASLYAGMNYWRNVLLVMFLSGGLAGLAGFCEFSGLIHRLQPSMSPGYGFTGITVAWLSRVKPLVALPVSYLVAALFVAGDALQISFRLPLASVQVVQGLVLTFALVGDFFSRYELVLEGRAGEGDA